MSKKSMSQRGIRYDMIVDEVIENFHDQHAPKLKLRNGGGRHYQRRHLKLIAYQTQSYMHDPLMWKRGVSVYRETNGAAHVYLNDVYSHSDLSKTETYSITVRDGFQKWMNDVHVGRERWSSAVLSQKHLPPAPIKKIEPSSLTSQRTRLPSFGLSWQAIGHQLSLKDLAADAPFENKLMAAGLEVMDRLAFRSRNTGKSTAIAHVMIEAHAITNWYATHRPAFGLHDYQIHALEFLNQRKPVLLPLV